MKIDDGVTVVYTHSEVRNEIMDILSREKFEKNKIDVFDKANDLRALLCGFAYKVWSLGSKHNFSVVEGINDDQDSLGCENSLLQAINLDREQVHLGCMQKDKRIEELLKQLKRNKEIQEGLSIENEELRQKIQKLAIGYKQAKNLFDEEIKYIKTQTLTCYSAAEENSKEIDLTGLVYKLHLAEDYVRKMDEKFAYQNQVISNWQLRFKRAQEQIRCLNVEMMGLQGKIKILQGNNQQKKQKISQLLEFIEKISVSSQNKISTPSK